MPRVLGIEIPGKKRVEYALRYIYGIGLTRARQVVAQAGINPAKKADELTDEEITGISNALQGYNLEGDLRREVAANIRRLIGIGCYRGSRHRKGWKPRASANRRRMRAGRARG